MKKAILLAFLLIGIFSSNSFSEQIWGWGDNANYQLGDGSSINKSAPQQIGSGINWSVVACGTNHSIAIKSDSSLWAWGLNSSGQLGDGTNTSKNSAVRIGTLNTWTSVSCGESHSLSIKADGSLWAWGLNSSGQLGDGTNTARNTPTLITTANNWSKVACGDLHTAAIKNDGTLWAWGANTVGQLGDGTNTNKNIPVQIGTATNWAFVACGYQHSVAIRSDGTLWAWGNNSYGQVGDSTYTRRYSPVQIGTATNWAKIACGDNFTIAIKADGSLWAWGYNVNGRLGDGTTTIRIAPVQIGTASNWVQLDVGGAHTLAVKADSSLWAWGYNASGQLGDGTNVNKTSPVQICKALNIPKVSLGNNHTFVLGLLLKKPVLISPANNANGVSVLPTFSWTATNYAYYELQLATDAAFSNPVVNETNVASNSFTVSNTLSFSNQYYLRVRGRSATDSSAWSDVCGFQTQALAAPVLVLPVDNAAGQPLTVVLDWNDSEYAEFYNCQLSSNSDFSSLSYDVTTISSMITIPNSILEFNTTYYWRVKSIKGENNSVWASRSFKTVTLLPSLVLPVNNAQNIGITPTLDWNDVEFANSYKCQLSTNADFADLLIDETTTQSTFVIPNNTLGYNTKYYWAVKSISGNYTSQKATSSFTTASLIPVLVLPANNSINNSINTAFDWNDIAEANRYNLQISSNINFTDILIDTLITSTDLVAPGDRLFYARAHYWRVRSVAGTYLSPWSAVWNFTIAANQTNFKKISFQCILTNTNGEMLPDGNYSLTLRIYDRLTGSVPLWTENHVVNISNGTSNLIIGSITPLNLPFNTSYWLGLKINDEPELSPRMPLVGNIYNPAFGN